MLKKILFIFLSFFAILLIQTTIVRYIRIDAYAPDFIFIFLIFVALFYDEILSMILAFVIGIIVDSLSFGILGLSPLLLTIIVYIIGRLRVKFVTENPLIQIVLIFFTCSFYSIIVKLFSEPEINRSLRQDIIDVSFMAVFTALFSPIIIYILSKIKKTVFVETKTYEV